MLLDDPDTRASMVSLSEACPVQRSTETVLSSCDFGKAETPCEGGDDSFKRKCKIICTMGPCCWDVPMLVCLGLCGLLSVILGTCLGVLTIRLLPPGVEIGAADFFPAFVYVGVRVLARSTWIAPAVCHENKRYA